MCIRDRAKDIGLVDELGGVMKAAKELAEIDADAKINLKQYPRPKTTTEQLEDILGGSVKIQDDIASLGEIAALPEVQALIKARQATRIGNELKTEFETIK